MISPSEANQVESCGFSAWVRKNSVPTTSPAAAFGGAFAALVEEDCPEPELMRRLDLLSVEKQQEVKELALTYLRDTPRGPGAKSEWKFALKADGILTDWEDPDRVTRGKIDAWWEEPGFLVVRDDKTGFMPVIHPADNLQFGAYAKALLARDDAPWGAKVRAEVCNPTKEPSARLLSYVYGPGEVEALWERFLAADRKASVLPKPLAEPGSHCAECWQRQQCPARLLPAMMGTPGDLAPFTAGGPKLETNEQALKGHLLIDALEDVIARAKEHLEAWANEHDGIRDGKGNVLKSWPTKGRRTGLGADELEKRGMGNLVRVGKPGTRFAWGKEK